MTRRTPNSIGSVAPAPFASAREGVWHRPHDLHAGEPLVVAFDERPRWAPCARTTHHLVDGVDVGVPPLVVPPILVGHLPALVRRLLSVAEAAEQLVLADVEEELHDDRAVVDELLLKRVDIVVSTLPFVRPGRALDAPDEHLPVPARVEDGDPTGATNAARSARGSGGTVPRRSALRLVSPGSNGRRPLP